jgi:hypothetical protein
MFFKQKFVSKIGSYNTTVYNNVTTLFTQAIAGLVFQIELCIQTSLARSVQENSSSKKHLLENSG